MWKVEWEAQIGMCQGPTSTFENRSILLWMQEWRETIEQIDWRAKLPSRKIWSVQKLEILAAGINWAKDITTSIAWRRGSARRASFKGRKRTIINQDEHWNRFKGNIWKTFETRDGSHNFYGLFQAHRYHLELNWSRTCINLKQTDVESVCV